MGDTAQPEPPANSGYRLGCPRCEAEVTEVGRACGGDPHVKYRCTNRRCGWSGRSGLSMGSPVVVTVEGPCLSCHSLGTREVHGGRLGTCPTCDGTGRTARNPAPGEAPRG
jgi:hypothetical protein